jgi:hypothetical protein
MVVNNTARACAAVDPTTRPTCCLLCHSLCPAQQVTALSLLTLSHVFTLTPLHPPTYLPCLPAPPGLGPAWHLAQVEVFHPGLQKTFTFPCNDWLEATKDKGLDGCKRLLKTGAAAAAGGWLGVVLARACRDIVSQALTLAPGWAVCL